MRFIPFGASLLKIFVNTSISSSLSLPLSHSSFLSLPLLSYLFNLFLWRISITRLYRSDFLSIFSRFFTYFFSHFFYFLVLFVLLVCVGLLTRGRTSTVGFLKNIIKIGKFEYLLKGKKVKYKGRK